MNLMPERCVYALWRGLESFRGAIAMRAPVARAHARLCYWLISCCAGLERRRRAA